MKTIEFQTSDEIAARLEKLLQAEANGYESVNTSEVKDRDALLSDLILLGLDELDVQENEFPDDVED